MKSVGTTTTSFSLCYNELASGDRSVGSFTNL